MTFWSSKTGNHPDYETTTLGQVLDPIERWQQWMHGDPGIDYDTMTDVERALLDVPIVAFRALAEQHAAQLRQEADDGEVGEGIASEPLRAAADFLCATRKE